MRPPRVLALALALACGSAPVRAQSHDPGRVVLLGELADASQVPELTGPSASSILLSAGRPASPQPLDARLWGGAPDTRIVQVPRAREADAQRELLAQVRAADRIALGPGTALEWFEALSDRGRSSPLASALREAWSGGATLVGRGDSAALLSAAFVVGSPAELEWDERNPRDDGGPRAATGLGCQPWLALDTELRSSGSARRLLRTICRDGLELGLYLPARTAVVVQVSSARLAVRGEGHVLIVDARRARRLRNAVQGVRLSRVPAGVEWDAAERRVPLAAAAPQARPPGGAGATPADVADLYDPRDLASLTGSSALTGARWLRTAGGHQLELRFDVESRWGRSGTGPEDYWVDGLACDLAVEDL